jgi:hypothetical protein
MTFCGKWQVVALVVGLAPYGLAWVATFGLARVVRRVWLAGVLALLVPLAILGLGVPVSLVLWNGIAPAPSVCEGF